MLPSGDAPRILLQEALTKLPRLAFAAALDTWRWDVFQGKVRGRMEVRDAGREGE